MYYIYDTHTRNLYEPNVQIVMIKLRNSLYVFDTKVCLGLKVIYPLISDRVHAEVTRRNYMRSKYKWQHTQYVQHYSDDDNMTSRLCERMFESLATLSTDLPVMSTYLKGSHVWRSTFWKVCVGKHFHDIGQVSTPWLIWTPLLFQHWHL